MTDQPSWYGSFLASLSPRVRETILALARSFRFRAGETIFSGGDPSTRVYVVKTGKVGIIIHIPSKNSQNIMTCGPGDLFSWSALVEPRIETAAARALEDCEVLGISGDALLALCEDDPAVGYELYRSLAAVLNSRLRATRLQLLDVFAA